MPLARTVVIVIDGLDECSDPAAVLDALAIGIEGVSVRLRVLVCSRPYAAIQSKFRNTPLYHLASQNHFHDINPETLSNDVAVFLTWSLGEIASRPANAHLPVPWPPKEQLDELIYRASGLILIASTYTKYIDDPEEGDPAAQLNSILGRHQPEIGSSPLDELDALYDQVLDDLKRSIKTTQALEFAQEIIETVVLAEGQINLEGLAGLFAVQPPKVRSVLRRLTAVIRLPEDPGTAITPFHASFGEYIQDSARCTIRELSVDAPLAHGRIADRCIAAIVSAAENGITGVETVFSGVISPHLYYASKHLADHIASSHDRASEHRKTAMGSGVWTWLDLMYCFQSLSIIRSAVGRSGFEELLRIEGVRSYTDDDASITRLMTANHVVAINRAEVSRKLSISATGFVESNQAKGTQLITMNLPRDSESRSQSLLDIAREARCWNQHKFPDLFIQNFTGDLKIPTEVQLRISSSVSFRGLSSLSEYLKRTEIMDLRSRIHLALKIANQVRHLHETSLLHAHGWLIPDLILVGVRGDPVLKPRTWALAESPEAPGDGHSVDCQMIQSKDWVTDDYWYAPENQGILSPQAVLRFLDIWDYGAIVFQIMTSVRPLTRYKYLAKGHPALGHAEDRKSNLDVFWSGSPADHGYQAHYERAASLLINESEECEEVRTVLKACWAFRPQDRPSIREVVEQLETILQARGDRR